MMAVTEDSIVFTGKFDGKGGAETLAPSTLNAMWQSEELLWVHLNALHPETEQWLNYKSGLHSVVVEALLTVDTRPRSLVYNDGLLLIARGINLNVGAEPEDMITLRTWIQNNNIITLRNERSYTVQDIISDLERGRGPCSSGEFLVEVLDKQLTHISQCVDGIEQQIELLDNDTASEDTWAERLKNVREQALTIRRYLSPQRDVIAHLSQFELSWLNKYDKIRLQEIADRTARYVEDLDVVIERACYLHDEKHAQNAKHLNDRIYRLTMLTTVFLPLHLIAGMMGANVPGIPLADSSYGFWAMAGAMGLVATVLLLLLRRKGLF